MHQILSVKESLEFPFLKDYDFRERAFIPGQINILTPENELFYEKIPFWSGQLAIMPIVQSFFNSNRPFSLNQLNVEIEKDEKLNLFLAGVNGKAMPIHYSSLQIYEDEGIVWCKRNVDPLRPIFFDDDFFYPGALYNAARVIK